VTAVTTQLQAVASVADGSTLALIVVILGALFTLIGGGYIFTWLVFMEMRKVTKDLYQKLLDLHENDLSHIGKRLDELER